jgi:hypothetical protein
MVAGTAVEAEEAFTEAAVADFMGATAGFTAEEDSPADTLGLVAAAVRLAAGLVAASTEAEALMVDGVLTVAEVGAVEVGAAEAGAEDTVTAGAVGAGDLATAGPIGDMAGAIRMATTATVTQGIPRHTLMIRIRLTEIPMDILKTT